MNPRQALFLGLFLTSASAATALRADSGDAAPAATPSPGAALLEQVLAQRPATDLALKARLMVDRSTTIPITILVKNLPAEIRTIYRTADTEALIIQPLRGEPRYFVRGVGELTDAARFTALAGSQFTFFDLGLPFLRWPEAKLLPSERYRGRACDVVEVATDDGPYRRARLLIDSEYRGLLRAELFNEHNDLVRTFSVTSFRRVGELWLPRGMELAFRPPGQSLPAAEKSRLEIFEGNDDARLAVDDFSPERF